MLAINVSIPNMMVARPCAVSTVETSFKRIYIGLYMSEGNGND